MIVVACPGQGSQKPGFLAPWLERGSAKDMVETWSNDIGVDLVKHGTESDADTIRDTAIAQPLIVAAGLLALDELLLDGRRGRVGGFAGHSVGEITAAAAAGILTGAEAMRFVSARANEMKKAADAEPTGMAAVVGGVEADVLAAIEKHGLEPANFNGGGQIVAAGSREGIAALVADAPRGARVIPLQVAGAFHTRYMRPAAEALAPVAAGLEAADPDVRIWTNRDGSEVTSGHEFVDLLVGQVASPVRWDLCMESFQAAGITGIIEIAPAGALVGLAKRGLKGVPSVGVSTPDDLERAIELLDAEKVA